jgi:hypothetical protein
MQMGNVLVAKLLAEMVPNPGSIQLANLGRVLLELVS